MECPNCGAENHNLDAGCPCGFSFATAGEQRSHQSWVEAWIGITFAFIVVGGVLAFIVFATGGSRWDAFLVFPIVIIFGLWVVAESSCKECRHFRTQQEVEEYEDSLRCITVVKFRCGYCGHRTTR